MTALRPLMSTLHRLPPKLHPLWRWLAWCLLAWLSARVIADGANLAWRLAHPTSSAPQAYAPPPAALPVIGSSLWHNAPDAQGPALPLTRLPLTIVGVARGAPLAHSVLILGTSQGQRVVTMGERIDDQVRLVDITPEGLILENQGRRERLPWPQPADSAPLVTVAQPTATPTPAPQSQDSDVNGPTHPVVWPDKAFTARFGEDYRQSLFKDPAPLLRYIQAAPVLEGQKLKGYRLRPGADASLFEALPLESGDVLVAVEGHAISESGALGLLQERLRHAGSLHVQLQRDGQPITLKVEFSS